MAAVRCCLAELTERLHKHDSRYDSLAVPHIMPQVDTLTCDAAYRCTASTWVARKVHRRFF